MLSLMDEIADAGEYTTMRALVVQRACRTT